MLGYEAVPAENGRTALEVYDAQHIDLIISDVQMPLMSGTDLLKALRDKGDSVPFIILTGFDESETRELAQTYKATDFLLKPFRILQLRDLLEKLFFGKSASTS